VKKYQHATNLLTTRKHKLAECTQKRRETEKLEEEERLPKHWKTGSALHQEEEHLSEQIAEAERNVRRLEKHLVDIGPDVGETEGLV
ncbi:hypothetical protein L873DRAFT_1809902, partial [Choiromyces venosus 120613-1]